MGVGPPDARTRSTSVAEAIAGTFRVAVTSPVATVRPLDPTFGVAFAPDAGVSTSKNLTAASAAKRFYRVKSIRPLP
jgi:hypothetical protein